MKQTKAQQKKRDQLIKDYMKLGFTAQRIHELIAIYHPEWKMTVRRVFQVMRENK